MTCARILVSALWSVFGVAAFAARNEHYRASRVLFERLLQSDSSYCKAWVSYAMVRVTSQLSSLRTAHNHSAPVRDLASLPCPCAAFFLQMEKRCAGSSPQERFARCRAILQRGLALNPTSACLVQVRPLALAESQTRHTPYQYVFSQQALHLPPISPGRGLLVLHESDCARAFV